MTRPSALLPTSEQLREAIRLYVEKAYGQEPPAAMRKLVPPEDFRPADWLMEDQVERDPSGAPLQAVRSFALRLGNRHYPHMKLRLSRPPRDAIYLFSVDSHDAFLQAPPGSPDFAALEQLKKQNAVLSSRILEAWDQANLPTEKNYLRLKIRQAKDRKDR